jgi:hypothetical protein
LECCASFFFQFSLRSFAALIFLDQIARQADAQAAPEPQVLCANASGGIDLNQ